MARNQFPSCPLCGYDQSGVIATWADACPLHGTCSECGETIEWRFVFKPSLIPLRVAPRISGWLLIPCFVLLGIGLLVFIAWIAGELKLP